MKFNLVKETITIYLEGRITADTALEVEKELFEILEKNDAQKVVLDMSNVSYISSAGLRVILKVKQKCEKTAIQGCNLDVYEVFEMTGFTEIMTVKKALKQISLKDAKVIGDGYFSTVYRLDGDTIIKVFNRTSDEGQIERELRLAREAFILGIPTAIPFDIVKADDKLGVRFEMLDCQSLKDVFKNNPDKFDELISQYGDLLNKINSTECHDAELPNMKKFYQEKIEKGMAEHLSPEKYQKLVKMIDGIEDTPNLIHGDCHFKNIMVQDGQFLLIDMDTLSTGNRIFEFAQIRVPYVAFDEDDPGNSLRFFGVSNELTRNIYERLVEYCFGKKDELVMKKIAILCYAQMVWWNRTNEPENDVRYKGCLGRLEKLLDEVNDLNI